MKKYTVDTGNPTYSSLDDVLFDKDRTTLIAYPNRESTQYEIPSSVTSIGDQAFAGCYSLTSITIPPSVTSIGDGAFENCKSLTSLTIPLSVTSIGDQAFAGCYSLTSITIPSSVTSIGDYAFRDCTAVKKYTVDTSNPNYSSLDDVLFNKDRTTLIAYPNRESSQYVIPSSVTTIGRCAFWGCSSLTSITIPPSVTSIGDFAFANCTGLSKIYCQKEVPLPITIYSFPNGVDKAACKLFVPKGSSASYSKAPYWKEFQTIIEEDSKVR